MSEATNNEELKRLNELIKDIEFAMLTTIDEDGTLRSRPMATQQNEFDGDIWFFTYGSSHKIDEVNLHHQVNVSYSAPDKQRYVSLSGTAQLVRDRRKMEKLWNPVLKAWFPKGLDEPDIALLKVNVTKAEYWHSPSSTVAHAVGLVKALVTGTPYDAGENEKINLDNSPATGTTNV